MGNGGIDYFGVTIRLIVAITRKATFMTKSTVTRPYWLFALCLIGALALDGAHFTAQAAWNHVQWPPPTSTSDVVATVPVSATVTASPPSITLHFIVAGKYQIFRKDPAATTWGTAITTLASDLNSWTDTNVNVGQLYEYKLIYTNGPTEAQVRAPKTGTDGRSPPIGYIMTGINVDETQPRGRVIVVVATDVPTNLPTEYNQYISDLQADGWFVHIVPVTPVPISPAGYDVGGTNACATITVTSGGTGYVAGAAGTTDATGNFRFTDTTTNSVAFGTLSITSGVITAVTVATGGGGGGFNVGDTLTISNVKTATGSGATFKVGSLTSAGPKPAPIRASIQSIYNQYPGEVKNLVLLGRVPACRTGSKYIGDPDGHQVNNGATGADGYYANMTGTWTDTGSNVTYIPSGGITLGTGEVNSPNDGKFDQYYMSESGGRADMGFGRIDLSNAINGQYEALKFYLNKLHRFKTASPDFQPGRRICYRKGGFPNIDETCWTMAYGVTGDLNQIDCIGSAELPTDLVLDNDAVYSAQHGPYLFYFKGDGGPGIGVGGKAVFWTGMQSHWGWWYSSTVSSNENAESLRLAEDSFGLSWTWDIFGTRYFYHRMAMGFDAGDMMQVSINNVDAINGTYANTTDINGWNGATCIAPCAGGLFMNHIGDPTLRFFMVAPPSNLSVIPSGGQPSLSWTASSDVAVIGYHVYRAPLSAGTIAAPYVRVTNSPVSGTSYMDMDAAAGSGTGQWSYMVRAVKLETTGSGTYYNASLGSVQSIDQTNPPAALAFSTPAMLPNCSWNTPYTTILTATGGAPNYTFTLVTGTVPPGLTLTSSGTFSGLPTTAGTYSFTVKVTDAVNSTAQQAFTLTAGSNKVTTLIPEASAYTIQTSSARVQGTVESMVAGAANYSYLRFNISGLDTDNMVASAKLRVYVAPGTPAVSWALLGAGLTPDSLVNWSMGTLCWNNQPADDAAVPTVFASAFPVANSYVDFDVTQDLLYALAHNTTGKFGLRLFSQTNQSVTFCSSWSYGGAIPQLIIQTSDAPKITINSPTASPAVIYVGTGVQLSATITPTLAGAVARQWSQISGPGTTTFGTPNEPTTTAAFSAPGDYVLQLMTNDTVLQSVQQVKVRVVSVPINGPMDSMVLYLPFNESSGTTTADASGMGNNGALAGGATFSSSGYLGNALQTSGSQMASIPDSSSNPNPIDNKQAMSISMWIKPASLLTDASFVTLINKSGAFQLQVRQQSNGGQIFNSMAGITSQQSPHRIQVGTWTHIAAVFNGSDRNNTLQLYINGVPDIFSSSATTSVLRKATSNTFVGASSLTDTHGFIGMIDELRIYSRALSLVEIMDLASGLPGNIGPVIATNPSISGQAGSALPLTATVTDDDKPVPANLSYNWSELGGPAALTIDNPALLGASTTPGTPGTYTLQFTANDGAITSFANVTATITAPPGIATWRQLYFGTTDATGNRADSANPAGDGLSNLLKYALGLDPNRPYSMGGAGLSWVLPEMISGNHLSYTFTGTAADVTYIVEATGDLAGTWTPLYTHNGSAPGQVTVQDTQDVASTSKRFMRLRVTNP